MVLVLRFRIVVRLVSVFLVCRDRLIEGVFGMLSKDVVMLFVCFLICRLRFSVVVVLLYCLFSRIEFSDLFMCCRVSVVWFELLFSDVVFLSLVRMFWFKIFDVRLSLLIIRLFILIDIGRFGSVKVVVLGVGKDGLDVIIGWCNI